ncbi:MAG TPA: DUF1552 domain-containing protein [Polyangiaceae bacterium]|nr:DUF1552 domain-containing protein [Polyangiaceae bacterium]
MIRRPLFRGATPSRRAVLAGAGVCLGLPLVESLLPRVARGQTVQAPKRFIGYFVPSGMLMDEWTPTGTGSNWQATGLLAPLAPFQAQTNVLTGLRNTKQEDNLGDHAGGTGAFLTGRTVPRHQTVMGGPSIDQVLAATLGQETALRSWQLGGEGGTAAGSCDSGYPCAFANQISFTAAGVAMPKVRSVADAFQRLFAGTDLTLDPAEVSRRAALKGSMLDVVLDEAQALAPQLSVQDRPKIEQYLSSLREVEHRVQLLVDSPTQCTAVAPSEPADDDQLIETMSDLMALAFQCDLTRVITFQWGNAASNRNYGFRDPAILDGHHNISHHQGLTDNLDQLRTIDTWQVEKLAYLLDKLEAIEDLDGNSALHNSLIFYSSDISDGDLHNHDDMPVLLLGQAGGAVQSGRHIVYDDQPWFANLFVSIANALDVPIETFGENGDGPLSGIV